MMVYFFSLPFFSILLIVLQTTVADVIFSGQLVLEISIIIVIYAGFRFSLIRGGILAFVLGFVFDCIAGSVLGLFALIYVLVFLFSFFISGKMVTERSHIIALFTLFCTFLEEFVVVLFYNLAYGFDMLHSTPLVFLPQAVIIGLLAPVFFYMMRKVEVFFYDKPAQSAERSGTGRIPAEA
jgi:rod shape-determining protein MreD